MLSSRKSEVKYLLTRRLSPLVLHLLRKAQKVADVDLRAVVQHGPAGEPSEHLMLVGLQQLEVRTGRPVKDGREVHLEPPVVGGERPRAEIVLPPVLHGDTEPHLAELVGPPAVEQHVLTGGVGVAEAVTDVEAKRFAVHDPVPVSPVPGVVISPNATAPIERTEACFRRKFKAAASERHHAGGGHAIDLLIVIECTGRIKGGCDHHGIHRRLSKCKFKFQRVFSKEARKPAGKAAFTGLHPKRHLHTLISIKRIARAACFGQPVFPHRERGKHRGGLFPRFFKLQHRSGNQPHIGIVRNGERVDSLSAGEQGEVVLNVTPFYAEMGGEVGDTGTITADGVELQVTDTKAPEKGLVCHVATVASGVLTVGMAVSAQVDVKRRACIARNHTCTHILHAALRQVLGAHVKQAGSYVGPDRLRFDFTHFESVTPEQLKQVEELANSVIMSATATNIFETSLAEAREEGVTALFGEKYGDVVRVVKVGDFSSELCGGCHVANTAEIGLVKIVSESSVGANLRRIEAFTSYDALTYLNGFEHQMKELSATLRVPTSDVQARVEANIKQLRDLNAKRKANKAAAATGELPEALDQFTVGSDYPVFIYRKDGIDAGGMRNFWDIVRSRLPEAGACVLASDNQGTPILLAAGTDEAVEKGFNAGAVIKQISREIKGGGGGKPTMAQAGGKDVSGIDAALDAARKLFA